MALGPRRLGKYLLVEPIASGGMAEVWRAEVAGPAGFVKQVAVKLVRADRGDDGEMERMFIEEARLASRLHHAGIVHVFDLEQIEGRWVIAMELVHGRSLREVLARCREANVRFGLPRALQVALQVARALAYAHRPVEQGGAAGLVHRDVSPHNVLVSFEGEVKLTDFGIARALDAAGLTGPGTLKGKVGYMAPEQAGAGPVDARADVFALGVVLWELCTGRRLFARETEAATLRALVGDEPVSPPSFWNELVPPALDAIVLEALVRDPSRRLPGAEEMASRLAEVELAMARTPEERELRPLMRRLWPAEVPSRPTPPPARPGEGRGAVPPAEATTLAWPPRRAGTAGIAAAVLLAAAAAGWALRPRRDGPPVAERTPSVGDLEKARVGGGAAPRNDGVAAPGDPSGGPGPALASGPAGQAPEGAKPGGAGKADDLAAPGRAPPPGPTPAAAKAASPIPRPARAARASPAGPAPADGAAARRGVLASGDGLESLELPPASSGEGILFVNVTPWAEVLLGGVAEGYTPRELRLAAGLHRVRLVHPTRGEYEADVVVRPGERARLEPALRPVGGNAPVASP